jgi:hypothetical protein
LPARFFIESDLAASGPPTEILSEATEILFGGVKGSDILGHSLSGAADSRAGPTASSAEDD